MRLDRFRLLHLRRLRDHRLRTAVSVLGIASGVGLIVAMSSLLTSATATADATVALLGGARYEVTVATADLERARDAIADVERVEGVRHFVEVPMMIDDVQGWLVALEDRDGLTTRPAKALAATTGIRTGSALPVSGRHVLTGPTGQPMAGQIAGRAEPELRDRYGGRVAVADLETALRLRGRTGTETLLVHGQPDPTALATAAGDADIREAANRVIQARNTIGVMFTMLSILGAMGLVVGGFLLFNTMNMTVLDRRHEIASLRALGGDRRMILTGVLAEAATLGAVGSALGLVLGTAMARSVIATVPDAFARAIGTPLQTSVPATLLVVAWLLGVATAMASAIVPARRALRIEPLEALRPEVQPSEHHLTRRWWLIGAGVLLFVIPSGRMAFGAAMAGLLCIAAGAAPFIIAMTVGIARRLGASGELAATALKRSGRRVWGTTTVVMIAVAIAVTTSGLAVNLRDTTNENLSTILGSDFWIGTTSGDNIALVGLPTAWTTEFESIEGVRSIAANTWVPAESGPHIVGVQGVYGDSAYSFTRLATDDARARMAAGEGAVVIKQTALTFGYEVGDIIDIPGATPSLRLPIVAITGAIAPGSGGMVNISHDLFAAHYGIDSFARYEVQLEPGADPSAVREQLDRITAGHRVQIFTGEEFGADARQSSDQILALIAMMLLVIVTCAAVALLNTLLASTLERTNEFAVLRAIGATKRRIVTSVATEALAIGLTGAVLGAVAGSAYHASLVSTIRAITAFDIDYAFSPAAFAAAILTGIAIAGAGAILPCRRANRLDILNALAR
ncbi:FtsX-like permease family protein [Candidatus Poriferisodalis sp.]|uniref:FtsX-like permease family protein n=1 Tax=Candidatus Poriferisodalis sp. TaxID=3101277 RepID=UPI003AF9D27D